VGVVDIRSSGVPQACIASAVNNAGIWAMAHLIGQDFKAWAALHGRVP
jgi:hypothetical protein